MKPRHMKQSDPEEYIASARSAFSRKGNVIASILFAILCVLFFLPVLLVLVIELAIYVNMGICGYTGEVLPFVASIVIGTIQLGATVDYAILMTTIYKSKRVEGLDKRSAVRDAAASAIPSIIVSGMGLFAATFGVALYSEIDIISSMCMLLARGAVISMIMVAFILPAMFMLFDGVIIRTTLGMKRCINGGKKSHE